MKLKTFYSRLCFVFFIYTPFFLTAGQNHRPINTSAQKNKSSSYFKKVRQIIKAEIQNKKLFSPKTLVSLKKASWANIHSEHAHMPSSFLLTSKSTSNPLLTFFLLSLLLTNQVCALKTIDIIPSMVYQKAYTEGQEKQTFGPCELLQDGAQFCCDIKQNYVVECCLQRGKELPSRCASFDPAGILGDRTSSGYDTGNYDLLKAIKRYNAQSHTSEISKEANDLLIPRNIQNTNGTLCAIETFGTSNTKNKIRPYPFNDLFPRCQVQTASINRPEALPAFKKMIKLLGKKYNLAKTPKLIIVDDYHGAQCKTTTIEWKYSMYPDSPAAGANAIELTKSLRSCLKTPSSTVFETLSENELADCLMVTDKKSCSLPPFIRSSSSYLNIFFDDLLTSIFAHEMQHLKQLEFSCKEKSLLDDTELETFIKNPREKSKSDFNTQGNNIEAEADIASVLATNKPLMALYFNNIAIWKNLSVNPPKFTRDSLSQLLKGLTTDDDHPPLENRISLIFATYKNLKRARKLLIDQDLSQKKKSWSSCLKKLPQPFLRWYVHLGVK
ncbi:MAG: hypothetical protein UV38_C0003G0021 [candidate division TM6 bacterium GW2011_GWE2_42_60]|nr:MAG: hypothetical protein UV38_C0003G0021 [candidate division TM6 bacterium GW2011_GWE2_42_60]HBY05922.1 hypothetical protein [Candidatus Dependentiae bacterium]